jgi:serine/threonine protein phosphatase 1
MRFSRETLNLPRAVEPGVEIVAIGDIHGRIDLFDALLEEAAATPSRAPQRKLALTGDLVDRGPDSLGCLRMAADAGARIGAGETLALMGNHEILMRMALDPATPERMGLDALEVWLGNGGDAVVEQLLGRASRSASRRLLAALREAAPEDVLAWLRGLEPHATSGDVLFVHAGVNPKIPLPTFLATPWDLPLDAVEERAHWAWVRGPFLDHKPDARGHSGFFVVHGHTPLDRGHTRGAAEQVARFRLNLDGGSAATGQAKMAILHEGLAEVVTARAD